MQSDLLDAAAICLLCDVVVTVDTSIAYLAGSLGKEVWLLLPFAADWRLDFDLQGITWYPTVRIYRKPSAGDWLSVLDRVRSDLCDRLKCLQALR